MNGLLDLYEATFTARYLDLAIEYLGRVLDQFVDREQGRLWSVVADNVEGRRSAACCHFCRRAQDAGRVGVRD